MEPKCLLAAYAVPQIVAAGLWSSPLPGPRNAGRHDATLRFVDESSIHRERFATEAKRLCHVAVLAGEVGDAVSVVRETQLNPEFAFASPEAAMGTITLPQPLHSRGLTLGREATRRTRGGVTSPPRRRPPKEIPRPPPRQDGEATFGASRRPQQPSTPATGQYGAADAGERTRCQARQVQEWRRRQPRVRGSKRNASGALPRPSPSAALRDWVRRP